MTLDETTALAMAILFALTLLVNIASWVIDGNAPALGRSLMALAGLALYVLLVFGYDLRLALRVMFGLYVILHLLMGADTVVDWIKERRADDT